MSSSGRFSGQVVSDSGEAYQIQGELGRGGMGVVYRAFDPRIGRAVALKVGLASAAPGRLERLIREGEIAASLDHPGIVRVHSSGSIRGRPYLCFELVEGCEPLDQRFPRALLPERLRLVRQLGEALGYAHAAGVVHRDVKPENVLVDQAGRARLTDFGVARGQGQERLTGTGTALGTPFYAAPEQLRDGHRVGPPADVWSLGVILYQALTGELPFQGESLLALVAQITSGSFDPPRRLTPSVSPQLEAVCLRALQVDPSQRYPDGGEFAADLARAERGERPLAQAQTGGKAFALTALGLLSLALVAGALAFASAASPADTPPQGATSQSQLPQSPTSAWRAAAEAALAEEAPRRALEVLAQAPLEDEAANTLRARAWIALAQGQRALDALRRLPPGVPRAVLGLQAMVEGADPTEAEPLVEEGISLSDRDPRLHRWRLFEACARPAELEELEQAYRRSQRVDSELQSLQPAIRLHRTLARFNWEPDSIWALGEDSQHDQRLTQAVAFMEQVTQTTLADPQAQRAFLRGIQRWMLPRLRFALSRLHETEWRALALPGADLLVSPEADEARLLVLAGISNAMDEIIPPTLEGDEAALIHLPPERAAALPRSARRLHLAALLARGVTRDSPLARRRELTNAILDLLPPLKATTELTLRQSQGVEAGKEACLIEALRCTEDAWLAETRAEREAALDEARARLSAVQERCPPKWIQSDWRYLVTQVRLAGLSGDLSYFKGPEVAAWTDTRRRTLRLCFALEIQLLKGDLGAATLAARAIYEAGDELGGWDQWIHNQLLWLKDPHPSPKPTQPRLDHPFPWRSGAATQRLLEAGWRPGQPLYPALERR